MKSISIEGTIYLMELLKNIVSKFKLNDFDILSVLVTNVPSEQLFQKVGNLITK